MSDAENLALWLRELASDKREKSQRRADKATASFAAGNKAEWAKCTRHASGAKGDAERLEQAAVLVEHVAVLEAELRYARESALKEAAALCDAMAVEWSTAVVKGEAKNGNWAASCADAIYALAEKGGAQ